MRIAFYVSPDKAQEVDLVKSLMAGCPPDWELCVFEDFQVRPELDAHCCVGVKSAKMIRKFPAGKPWIYFDKAYNRDWSRWWRVSVCGHQPTDYLMQMDVPGDRAAAQGWKFEPWREDRPSGHVLYAGSSLKYNNMFDLGDPNEYAQYIVSEAAKFTRRKIVYRPKPSYKAAEEVAGAAFSYNKGSSKNAGIQTDLEGAHVLITHGSAAAFDAMIAGVPTVILGHAVTRPISSTSLADVDRPYLASEKDRQQILNALAYCQWNHEEMRGGLLWRSIRSIIEKHIPGLTTTRNGSRAE